MVDQLLVEVDLLLVKLLIVGFNSGASMILSGELLPIRGLAQVKKHHVIIGVEVPPREGAYLSSVLVLKLNSLQLRGGLTVVCALIL